MTTERYYVDDAGSEAEEAVLRITERDPEVQVVGSFVNEGAFNTLVPKGERLYCGFRNERECQSWYNLHQDWHFRVTRRTFQVGGVI